MTYSAVNRSYILLLATACIYLFLYIPIVILITFSFNSAEIGSTWTGFSVQWYKELFSSHEVWDAVQSSLIVALSSVVLSVSMGVMLVSYGRKHFLGRFLSLFYGSLIAPEIVLAVGLLTFFIFCSMPLGLTTLIAGHTLIGLGYVVPMCRARFLEIDYRITEASLDLGASRTQTFFYVILPLMSPAIISSGLLVFVLSLDDFLISFFCAGASVQTVPIYIYSLIRSGSTPVVNALSTVLLLVSSTVMLIVSLSQTRKDALVK